MYASQISPQESSYPKFGDIILGNHGRIANKSHHIQRTLLHLSWFVSFDGLRIKKKMKYPPQPGTAKIKNTPQESSDYLPTAPTVPEKCIFLFSNGLFIWFINSVRYRGASCFIPCETCMTWIHGTSPPTCRPDGEPGVVSMSNCGTVEIFAFSSWKLPNGGRAVY